MTQHAKAGVVYGVTAYALWGFFPLYFRWLGAVPPAEILAHRIIWSAALLLALMALGGAFGKLRAAVRAPRSLAILTACTLLLCTNWIVFLHAVDTGQVLQSSFGYFINPLVSVLLGAIFLGERMNTVQRAAVALAVAGVAVQGWMVGELPGIALILAGSFGTYGLLRKISPVDSMTSLTVECVLAGPVATGYLLYLLGAGRAAFLAGHLGLDLLLLTTSVVTVGPLLLFGVAMRRLRLATMGLLQYIVPTGHFALAVFAFGEPFSTAHGISFALIWAGLALYSWDSLRAARTVVVETVS